MKLWGAILAALLAGVLYLQWQVVPVQAPPIPRPRLDAPSGPVGPGAGTPAGGFKIGLDERAEYDGISRRPLFNESRRPDEPDAAAAAPQQDQDLEGLVLSAVLITPTQRVAWVRDGQAAQTLKLTAGERIRGWAVTDITQEAVQLTLGTQSGRLELRKFNAPQAGPAGPGGAAPTPAPGAVPAAPGTHVPRQVLRQPARRDKERRPKP